MAEDFDDTLWDTIVAASADFDRIAGPAWHKISDKAGTPERALNRQGFNALYSLLKLPSADEPRKRLFPRLVELACGSSSLMLPGRSLIESLPRDWVFNHIEPIANEILARPESGEWEYRRLAELYFEIDVRLLKRLLEQASMSSIQEVREVVEDFKEFL